jgi:exodeoxyribonuclease V alpha subunit
MKPSLPNTLRNASLDARTPSQKALDDALEQGLIALADRQLIERLVRMVSMDDGEWLRPGLLALAKALHYGSVRVSLEGAEWDAFRKAYQAGAFDRVIARSGGFAPVIYDDQALYSHQTFSHETDIADRLSSFLEKDSALAPEPTPAQIGGALHAILFEHPLTNAKGQPLDFSGKREQALRQSLRSRLLVISGGPGTGKTSLCSNLLRLHRHLFGNALRIALTAPTGRAAQRMTESLRQSSIRDLDDLESTTLHRLLGYDVGTGRFRFHETLTLPFDLVVVDEASMVDMHLFRALLRALPASARLVLLGDRDQLPSIAAGSLLVDLGPEPGQDDASAAVPWVTLTGSHRALPQLVEAGEKWRQGSFSHFGNGDSDATAGSIETDGAVVFYPVLRSETKSAWENHIQAWFRRHAPDPQWLQALRPYETPEDGQRQSHFRWDARDERCQALGPLFEFQARSQILAVLRQGPEGVLGLNDMARATYQPHWDPSSSQAESSSDFGNGKFFHGAPILVQRNDFERDLSNGDRGLAYRFGGKLWAVFQTPQHVDFWPLASMPHLELAFAATVHKCQGSEFDEVLLVLPPPEHPLLSREVVYTGLTRARRSVVVLGAQAALAHAAQKVLVRSSGLKKRVIAARLPIADKAHA